MIALIRGTVVELGVICAVCGRNRAVALVLCAFLGTGGVASAQPADSSWNVEGGVGWDISLSGDFLSAGIGTLNDQATIHQIRPIVSVTRTIIGRPFACEPSISPYGAAWWRY